MVNSNQSGEPRIYHQNRIEEIRTWADKVAPKRQRWRNRNSYFHTLDENYLKFLVSPNQRILALGCGSGAKLACLAPSFGVGVDISRRKIEIASKGHPDFKFFVGDIEDPVVMEKVGRLGPFDTILLYDSLGFATDIQAFLESLATVCTSKTRVVSVYYAYFWEPLLKLAEILKLKMKTMGTTWLRMSDVENFFRLSGFEPVKKEWRILLPIKALGLGPLVNRYIATLPVIRKVCLRHYLVARVKPAAHEEEHSVTVVIPCRNEKGSIEEGVERFPKLGSHTEIIFVEGHSSDGTWEEIERVRKAYDHLDIKALRQRGTGKGDAVREGFAAAAGEILMILDADLTVPPEDLPKFYEEIRSGRGEYINGSRLIYAMEDNAMRLLNFLANRLFAKVFSFLLYQNFTDTLCGTKAISRENYHRLIENRSYLGDFDPFGDFDLIFGATKLNLQMIEVPVRYRRRRYGTTKISRFRHGLLLMRMVMFAYRKLKLV